MKIIADSGSSKTQWIGIDVNGQEIFNTSTLGLNPYFVESHQMKEILEDELGSIKSQIKSIHFYGAGLGLEQTKQQVKNLFEEVFPQLDMLEVESDLLGTVRSLSTVKEGIACILGTGTNACYYQNTQIAEGVPSLGYILGDWASGAVLGKQFIAALLKGEMSIEITTDFYDTYDLDTARILNKVYKQDRPNQFLASFMPFFHKYRNNDLCKEIIRENIINFFDDNVERLLKVRNRKLPIGFVGSVAFYFKDFILEEMRERKLALSKIERSPLEGLKVFHLENSRLRK